MTSLSVVMPFTKKGTVDFPVAGKHNTFKKYPYVAVFGSVPNTPAAQEELKRLQRESGIYGFLDKVLKSIDFDDKELTFDDEDGESIDALEFVKRNQIAANNVSLLFWSMVNRELDAKNLQK